MLAPHIHQVHRRGGGGVGVEEGDEATAPDRLSGDDVREPRDPKAPLRREPEAHEIIAHEAAAHRHLRGTPPLAKGPHRARGGTHLGEAEARAPRELRGAPRRPMAREVLRARDHAVPAVHHEPRHQR